jgi:hypothetical protein
MPLNDEWLTTEEMLEKQRAQVQSTSIQQTYNTTSFIQGKSTSPTQSDVALDIQSTTESRYYNPMISRYNLNQRMRVL